MDQIDPNLRPVFDKFEPLLGDHANLKKALEEASLDEIQIMIANWEWTEHPISLRLFQDVEERKIPEEHQQRYEERNRQLAATYPPLRKELPELEPARKPVTPGQPWKPPHLTDRATARLDKGAVQTGGLDKGAVQSRRSTPSGAIRPSEDQTDPDDAVQPEADTQSDEIYPDLHPDLVRVEPIDLDTGLDEEDVDVRKEVRTPFSPLPKDDPEPVEIEAEAIAGGRADADWRRAAAGTPILRRTPGGESVGRTIIARRQEILENAPGVKGAINDVLAYYRENLPNDPSTQQLVERLETLSSELDTYVAVLQTQPTEAQAESAGKSLYERALSAIKEIEDTTVGNKFLRLTMYAGVLGTAALAAPMVSPYLTVPLMTACVFPDETKVATSLFKELKGLAEKVIFPSKSDKK